MTQPKSDLPQGTLDLLILKVVTLGPIHGYAIAQRIQQISRDVLQVQQGSLYPALHRLENRGLLAAEWKDTETGREAKFYRLTDQGPDRAQVGDRELEATGESRPPDFGIQRGERMSWWRRLLKRGEMERHLGRRAAFPLRRLGRRQSSRRHERAGRPPQRPSGIRRRRAGERRMPRRARHALGGGSASRSPVRTPLAEKESGVFARGYRDSCARHWSEYRHLQRAGRSGVVPATLSRTGTAGCRGALPSNF